MGVKLVVSRGRLKLEVLLETELLCRFLRATAIISSRVLCLNALWWFSLDFFVCGHMFLLPGGGTFTSVQGSDSIGKNGREFLTSFEFSFSHFLRKVGHVLSQLQCASVLHAMQNVACSLSQSCDLWFLPHWLHVSVHSHSWARWSYNWHFMHCNGSFWTRSQ